MGGGEQGRYDCNNGSFTSLGLTWATWSKSGCCLAIVEVAFTVEIQARCGFTHQMLWSMDQHRINDKSWAYKDE